MSVDHGYRVTVTLPHAVTDLDDVLSVLAERLAVPDVTAREDPYRRTVLTIVLESDDLWLALLLAMSGVTATGYVPVAVRAEPFTRR